MLHCRDTDFLCHRNCANFSVGKRIVRIIITMIVIGNGFCCRFCCHFRFFSVDMCVDVTCINKIDVVTSTGCPLHCRKTTTADNGKAETLCKCSDKISRICDNGGCRINIVNCDNGFCSVMEDVKDELKCSMNHAGAQDHKPRAERNDRAIEKQVQVRLHRSTHETTPRVMTKEPAASSTEKFNFFPAENRTSDHCGPETSLTGRTLNCKKQCQHEFGECVQAHVSCMQCTWK